MRDLFSLDGKNVILTGGCGNLGRVMAEYLLEYGAKLFITTHSGARLSGLSGDLHYIDCDLSDTAGVQAMLRAVEEAGGPDVLINTAAWGGGAGGKRMTRTRLEDFDDETWAYGLEILGGYATPDLTSGDLRVLQHEGTGSHDTAFAHLTAVE